MFPRNARYNLDRYGPIIVPKSGDIVKLNSSTLPTWEKVIRQEGHSLDQTSWGIYIDGKHANTYTINQNYLFMLGDNYYDSNDSRFWGFLPEENVIGKAEFIYWSVETQMGNGGLGGFLSSIRWNRVGNYIR
ncbi:MAG: signal peptidase I [Bacteroidota bacterium]